jgi:hypothetical protein
MGTMNVSLRDSLRSFVDEQVSRIGRRTTGLVRPRGARRVSYGRRARQPFARCANPLRAFGIGLRPTPSTFRRFTMNTLSKTLMCACIAFSATGAFAQDAMMKKDGAMAKDGMMKKEMTMQDCKDHMAMAKKDGMKKDDAMMKKDAGCDAMMKKDDSMMKKDGMAHEPMKK